MWAGLLRATGGTLVPEKCFWYYIHNTWDKGKWQYVKMQSTQGIHVPDKNSQPTKIPQLSPLEAHRTLRVWLAPDRNNADELQYLQDIAKSWHTSMSAAKVMHVAAEFSLCQVILWKLEYPLVATTLTQTECNTNMSPILTAGLPAAGLTQTFPRAIVHRPWQWGGLNISNLFMEQITKHIHTMMKFGGNMMDMTGILLQASCEAFQLEAGLKGAIIDLLEAVYSICNSNMGNADMGILSMTPNPKTRRPLGLLTTETARCRAHATFHQSQVLDHRLEHTQQVQDVFTSNLPIGNGKQNGTILMETTADNRKHIPLT